MLAWRLEKRAFIELDDDWPTLIITMILIGQHSLKLTS